jgi:hypothetical protein
MLSGQTGLTIGSTINFDISKYILFLEIRLNQEKNLNISCWLNSPSKLVAEIVFIESQVAKVCRLMTVQYPAFRLQFFLRPAWRLIFTYEINIHH